MLKKPHTRTPAHTKKKHIHKHEHTDKTTHTHTEKQRHVYVHISTRMKSELKKNFILLSNHRRNENFSNSQGNYFIMLLY